MMLARMDALQVEVHANDPDINKDGLTVLQVYRREIDLV
jgi:hypothetical protein